MYNISGVHLIIDAYVVDAATLTAEHLLRTCDDLIVALGMQKLGKPVVREVPVQVELLSTKEDEGGLSIIVPITTSHLAIHTWPERRALMMDIFSCRPFDADQAYQIAAQRLHFAYAKRHDVHRVDPKTTLQLSTPPPNYFPWQRA